MSGKTVIAVKVLHLSTSDIFGGAAKAAFRLHFGLKSTRIDSNMLVQDRRITDNSIYGPSSGGMKAFSKFSPYMDRLPLWLYSKSIKTQFHIGWLPDFIEKRIKRLDPDIVHLHWICDGFVNLRTLNKIQKPIVWTVHDMWPFTGGCHYAGDCQKYTLKCGECPKLESKRDYDLSRLVWKRKRKWAGIHIRFVAPSRWIGQCLKESTIFKNSMVDVIPNGLDLTCYKPFDKSVVRNMLNLPLDKRIILFGSIKATSDHRKGIRFLKSALNKLQKEGFLEDKMLLVFGGKQTDSIFEKDVSVRYYGYLHDDISLSLLYAASDVYILPSIQDNLPNTIIEALACGTPCVSFAVGGIPDMIEHKKNGYLAELYDIEDLSCGIRWVLENQDRYRSMQEYSRIIVEEKYDIRRVTRQYMKLYDSVIQG